MNEHGTLSCMVLIAALILLPGTAAADEGLVMLVGQCPYMVLDSSKGQVLVKRVTGTAPEVGDVLVGEFDTKTFSRLTNQRTGKKLRVWVNRVDRYGNRAMARRSSYCR